MPKLPRAAALALLAAGCAAPPQSLQPTAHEVEPARLSLDRTLDALAPARAPLADAWWKRFGDPQLDRLMDEALAGNPSLGVVRARVEQARAGASAAGLPLTPSYTARASSSRQRLSENGLVPPPFGGAWIWQNEAMLDFRRDFDFWGRHRKAYEAALGSLRAAELDAHAARLVLEAAVASGYFALEAAFEQRDIARDAVAQRERVLELTRARVRAGLDSRLEAREAEGRVPQAREAVAAAEQAIALARDRLAALVGAGPDRGLALAAPRARAFEVGLPARLPADLLARRPDIAAQRMRIEAAAKGIDSARAAYFPDLELTAFAGLQSLDFARFLRPGSLTVGAGPALHLPLFERGALDAALEARNAEWDLAVAQYNQSIVDALREVVDQLATLRGLDIRERETAAAVRSLEQAHELALARYRGGLGDYLHVLAAEDPLLAARSRAAELRARRRDATVALIHALGGGYEPARTRTSAR